MPRVRDYPLRLKQPVRDVQAFLSSAGGLRPYALASADFEPLVPEGEGADVLAFVNDVPAAELPPEFGAAFGEGVLAELRAWSFNGVPPYAVRVRLRDARWREGESTAAGFAWAGRRAAREAGHCIHEGVLPRPYVTRWPPARTATHPVPEYDVPGPRPSVPGRPVRDVRVRLVTPSACGVFAIATTDFEPLPADSGLLFEFAAEVPEDRLPREFADAFEHGVHHALCASGTRRVPTAAFRVRLHDATWHEVDSNEVVFAKAGRRAAAEALRCCAEGGAPRPVDPWPAHGGGPRA